MLVDTEIDWTTYNQQVALYLNGERDYTLIKGSTGPLVYPALHVYIYSVLHKITAGGEDVLLAQGLFAGLYLSGLLMVGGVYWKAKVRLILVILVILVILDALMQLAIECVLNQLLRNLGLSKLGLNFLIGK